MATPHCNFTERALNKRGRGLGRRGWNNVPHKQSIILRGRLPDWPGALGEVPGQPATHGLPTPRESPRGELERRKMQTIPIHLDEETAAACLGQRPKTLEAWRRAGKVLPFLKLGRSVRYRLSDVLAYLDRRVYTSSRQARERDRSPAAPPAGRSARQSFPASGLTSVSSLPWDKPPKKGNLDALFPGGFRAGEPPQEAEARECGPGWCALRYAGRGWPVLPLHSVEGGRCTCGNAHCGSPGEHPRTKNSLRDATVDARQIAQWWQRWPGANPQCSSCYRSPSGCSPWLDPVPPVQTVLQGRYNRRDQLASRFAEGGRNNALASLAGTLRRQGVSPTAIEAALQAENAGRCVPPLPSAEVSKIASSVGRYQPEYDYAGPAQVDIFALLARVRGEGEATRGMLGGRFPGSPINALMEEPSPPPWGTFGASLSHRYCGREKSPPALWRPLHESQAAGETLEQQTGRQWYGRGEA